MTKARTLVMVVAAVGAAAAVAGLYVRCERLQVKLAKQVRANQTLERELGGIRNDTRTSFQSWRQEADRQIAVASNKVVEAENRYLEERATTEPLRRQVERLLTRQSQLQSEIVAKSDQLDKVRQDLAAARTESDARKTRVSELEAKLAQATQDQAQKDGATSARNKELTEARAALDAALAKVRQLETEKEALRVRADTAVRELESLRGTVPRRAI